MARPGERIGIPRLTIGARGADRLKGENFMENQVVVIAGLMILAIIFLMAMFAKLFRKAGPHEAIIV